MSVSRCAVSSRGRQCPRQCLWVCGAVFAELCTCASLVTGIMHGGVACLCVAFNRFYTCEKACCVDMVALLCAIIPMFLFSSSLCWMMYFCRGVYNTTYTCPSVIPNDVTYIHWIVFRVVEFFCLGHESVSN